MEHFVRIAFWITLSGCLHINSKSIGDFGAGLMLKEVECPNDSRFYTPKNVKESCITTALDCVMRELNGTAIEECQDPNERLVEAVSALKREIDTRMGNGLALSNSTECACETWSQSPFSKFVVEAEYLFKQENAAVPQQ